MINVPPLLAGDRLDRATFQGRYEAMPPSTRAELIGAVVHLPQKAGSDHGDDHLLIAGLIGLFERATFGVRGNINSTTILDDRNEVQPDCSLRTLAEYGGQTTSKWIYGAPELAVEISRSSRSIDLGSKREAYQQAGVREYVVFALDPDEIFWHVRRGDQLVTVAPGADGIYRSEAFPGFWLDLKAMLRRDPDGLINTLERGVASPDHARFVAELAARKRPRG